MQLAETKPYIAGTPQFPIVRQLRVIGGGRSRKGCSFDFMSQLKATTATERLIVLMLATLVLSASPALIATVRSTVAFGFQILVQIGHLGFTAFQIFGR